MRNCSCIHVCARFCSTRRSLAACNLVFLRVVPCLSRALIPSRRLSHTLAAGECVPSAVSERTRAVGHTIQSDGGLVVLEAALLRAWPWQIYQMAGERISPLDGAP